MGQTPDDRGKGYFKADWAHCKYRTIKGEHDIFGDGTSGYSDAGTLAGHQILRVKLREGVVILAGTVFRFEKIILSLLYHATILTTLSHWGPFTDLHRLIEEETTLVIHGHDPGHFDK